MHVFHFFNWVIHRPLVKHRTLAKIHILALETFIYVDEAFSKTVRKITMRQAH